MENCDNSTALYLIGHADMARTESVLSLLTFCLPPQACDRNCAGHLSRELAPVWKWEVERAL